MGIFLYINFLLGSGSKGAAFKKFYEGKDNHVVKRVAKFLKISIIFAFVGMFFTIAIEFSNNNLEFLLSTFIMRLIGSGDIFAYYYSDNFYNAIKLEHSIFYAIFGNVFAVARLLPYDDILPPIGLQIWQTVNSSFET